MKSQVEYRVRSMYFHTLLTNAVKKGFVFTDIVRKSERETVFRLPARQKKAFDAFLKEYSVEIRVTALIGRARIQAFFRAHPFLMLAAVCMVVFLYAVSQRVWMISANDENIRSALYDLGIRPGTPKKSVNGAYLSGALTLRFPEYAHVGIHLSGVVLTADARKSAPVPEVFRLEETQDIIAASDGIVSEIRVYSGTACVKAGDTVKKGQLLIKGEERAGKNGESTPVRAKGSVEARIWTKASCACPMRITEKRYTGKRSTVSTLITPFFEKTLAGENPYLLYEKTDEPSPIVGLFLPVTVVKSTFYEYILTEKEVTQSLAALAAEKNALASARRLAPEGANEVAYQTSFTVLGDTVYAEAVMEWTIEIAYDKQGG